MSKSKRTPTLRDVAERAGVSQSTVSIVLSGRRSGKDRISDETRQRVMEAVETLEYVPNQLARHLRRQSTERVSLAVAHLGVPYSDLIARDLQRVAKTHGYSMVINISHSAEDERDTLRQMRAGLADGVLMLPEYMDGDDLSETIELVVRSGIAVVVMSNYVSGPGFDIVRNTEYQTCYQAVEYLLKQGHRRIATIRHDMKDAVELSRFKSYIQAQRDYGVSIDEALIRVGARSRQVAYELTHALLKLAHPPTAIFSESDRAAISAIWAIRDAGLRVPEDVAVIGVGNIPEGEIMHPPLTTVGPLTRDFTDVSELLFSRLNRTAPDEGRIIEQPWAFIHRGSA
jgi:DNA-binding LacI/PurR family transcriptional regulator